MKNTNIINYDENEYNKYALIKPPEFKEDDQKFTRVIVDSRSRDVNLFPLPNNYEIVLEDDINDLISAELVYMDMPFTNYLINNFFNKINIIINNIIYTVILTNGDYDDNAFLTEFQTQLDTVIGSGLITISYITKTDSYSFTSNNPFLFKFTNYTNTLAMLLGFNKNLDYVASGTGPYTLNSPFKRNFNYNNYIIMEIKQFNVLKSTDTFLDDSFAIISQKFADKNICDQKYVKYFSPPIPRLIKICIKLCDKFGNPYDFQNQDHHFEILFTSCKQKRKYKNIFT